MTETRIKISSIVENQLPQYVKEEFPLISEFLSQYYISLENQGGTSDLLQNIDQYIKVDNLTNLIDSTTLSSDVTFFDSTINVFSTAGFPDSYGLLLIDSEIITYTSKTANTFEGCVRGFSGVTSYKVNDELTFTETLAQEHSSGSTVANLSILFLKEFLVKVKTQITPGFENRELFSELNERVFIKQAIDFYSSKGTDNSFKILFGALYGEKVEVIRPRDYLIQPSNAQYRITSDFVVEAIEGDPEELINTTLYQDKTDFIEAAQGTITKIERIRRGDKDYYQISLDSDYNKDIKPIGTVFGKFSIHSKTKTIIPTITNSTTLEVDSTVGFPIENGTLLVNLENGTTLTITYASKTLNQFLGCSGIEQDIPENSELKLDAYAYGFSNGEKVRIRILGVLSELKIPEDTKLLSKDDTIKIKTLGINLTDYKSNNWFFNIPVKYNVKKIDLLDTSDFSYRIEVADIHTLKVGDSITLISSVGEEINSSVISYNNERSFSVQLGPNQSELNLNLSYTVKKNLTKVLSENYPELNQFTSNVQNVYHGDDNSLYVASPSLPSYFNQPLKINDLSVTFSGTFEGEVLSIGRHGFYTGDSIVYKPSSNNTLGIATGVYFIKKISETEVKLARSRSNIFTENFVSVNGTVVNAKFELFDFTLRDLTSQNLETQKLIRKISNPETHGKVVSTEPGSVGIFINGVEALNYKSKDNVFYGPIEEIISTAGGTDYDIINPPVLSIIDPIGNGANGYCSVIGGLKRIDIIDPGFDYLEEPKIEITGGNGNNASTKVKLVSFDHEQTFNSISSSNLVKLNPSNTVGFSSYHKFRDAEEVVYITNGQTSVGGLSTNSTYFVSVQDEFNVKLHKSFSDAVSGINTIQLLSYGVGNHSFKSKSKKKKIGSIVIENEGSGYQNKLTTIPSSGINTASNSINIKNHGYESGEIIVYNSTQVSVGGLSSSSSYYVTKLNDDEFKLSEVGITTLGITKSFYYDTKQYINLTSSGSGIHKFNYPEIEVIIKGRIGVSTLTNQNFNAIINPVFRGEIQSVYVESGGVNYGSEDILNFNRQPLFELNTGSGIQVTPVISNGQIVDVLVNSPGTGYNSPPNIEVIGDGVGAILTPIFSNGTLVEIRVIYGGIGYNQNNTAIIVTPSGRGAKFEARIKSWKINLVERLIQNSSITEDDGILSSGLNTNYGLQYTHAYAPRQLRSLVQGTSFRDGKIVYTPDLIIQDSKEIASESHSPIIGWAYDGNPIYGPYGYSSKTGGSVKCLVSGYIRKLSTDRPKTSLYPQGFFVEDYEYNGSGDLDEHNGRFGVTPEYPNGVYAYFTTINSGDAETGGLFENYKKPAFPYIIGNSYKSTPIDFNFKNTSNQDFIDINQTNWKRNTTPYNLLSNDTSYEYLVNPNSIKIQNSNVQTISSGDVNSIRILNDGADYEVGDELVFENKDKFIFPVKAKVSSIKGKEVTQVSVSSSTFDNVTLYPYQNRFVGFTSIPHNLLNNDPVTFTGKFDYRKNANIIVNTNTLALTSGVGSAQYTGLVTYFNVAGNLNYPNVKENDIYRIGEEEIKILNIDAQSSRVRVLRNQNGTTGILTYSAGIALTEKTRRFGINFGISTSYNFKVNREFYFDPSESVGLGTTSGVGIVSTIYFSSPGVGVTQVTIPTQSIYLQNHDLITGDSLIYHTNGGTPISVSTDGISTFTLSNNSIVYVAKISNDLIGISTIKVGLSSIGTFVGLGSIASGLLYFNSVGLGNTHSFKTNYPDSLTGSISKNTVTVSTAETHGITLLDNVTVDIKTGISTTFKVKYDDYSRKMLINPRDFSSVNIENNTITITNHKYYTGQKVLHTSIAPANGLINQGYYYVIVVDHNTIMLSNSYYGATKNNPEIVNITSSGSGTISPINPPISVERNQPIVFDLSDSSLSYFSNSDFEIYSAFELKIYKDNKFIDEFDSTKLSTIFDVSKNKRVGIDTDANLTIIVNDSTPNSLHYKLVPINLDIISQVKKEIVIDNEVISANHISLIGSKLNGTYSVIGISSNTFKYNIFEVPNYNLLTSDSNDIKYTTKDTNIKGPIHQIQITNKGRGHTSLPAVIDIITKTGRNAVLVPETNNIGKVDSTNIQDIGFDYSPDYSIRPLVKYPTILELNPLSKFDSIGVTSIGRNYFISPGLVVLDGLTNKVIKDVGLSYTLGDSSVEILKNTSELSNVTPKIIPVNNSNGIKIKDITFNNLTKDVTVTIGASFSDPQDYPFFVGGRVLIEGISVGVNSTGKGYNSSDYDYSLFTITAIDPNIGGALGVVTFSLSSYLKEGEVPGSFNSFNSSARIVPEEYFPIFDIKLKKNTFYKGEFIESINAGGEVENWDPDNNYLKVSSVDDFVVGNRIKGRTSGSFAIIESVTSFDSEYQINSSSESRKGWNRETGFLNNTFQRIHDSDYYQYFSYDLKSKKDFNTWNNAVSTLNHTAGFKKFSNLISESVPSNSRIRTDQNEGDLIGITDLSSIVNVNCVYDFDLVKENNIDLNSFILSDTIFFNSAVIQDYIESIGNRVLIIDDISDDFNSNPRSTPFSIIDSFIADKFRSKKYIILIRDKNIANNVQLSLLSLTHNNGIGYLNQYGIDSDKTLGFFDFSIFGSSGNLLFYPIKSKFNDYHTASLSFSIGDSISGVGTVSLGDSVIINTNSTTISPGTTTPTTIVGIASTYRSSKVLVQIGATDSSYYEYDEITYIHNNSEVFILDYGQLSTDVNSSITSTGIGTYDAYISDDNVVIDFIPNEAASVEYVVNTFSISIASTLSSNIGSQQISGAKLDSTSTSIASTDSPVANIISSYSNEGLNNEFISSYSLVCVEDKTNSEYQISEFLTITDKLNNYPYTLEYGTLSTNSPLGIITTGLSTSVTNLYFTPIENIDVDVKVFQVSLSIINETTDLEIGNGSIDYSYGTYVGTENDVKKEFPLTHRNIPIFQRNFDASDSNIVNIDSNSIKIPYHFFVTGEEIEYSYLGTGTTLAIGIATTSITGVGTTDKLPKTLYIVKVSDKEVQVAASASDALKVVPNVLDFTSVGVGTIHTFTSKKQNEKSIITIDNVIQSPVVSTSVTSICVKDVSLFDSDIYVSSVESISGGDLIRINNEIMRVTAVGVGSTNAITVLRPWMGTGISTHSSTSLVTKILGNYNIVDNSIHFAQAPFGDVPFANPSNRPDEIDYVGITTSSTFSGRIFLRSGISESSSETYLTNYIFDDISDQFDGNEKTFTLKSNANDVTGIATDNSLLVINSIFQAPLSVGFTGSYDLEENSGITSITFIGNNVSNPSDLNTSSIPRGGIIISIGSTQGFGYQPLVSAGGTAVVSTAGTIQSISIGNSGSGYRYGIQNIVNVGVKTEDVEGTNIEFIGIASILNGNITEVAITNPGMGYTSTNPPIVVFDSPLSYSNIPLIYSSESSSGVGTGAVIDIVVGNGSSVISFELKNLGYGYKSGEILTVSIGGTTGIQTNLASSFSEFQIIVNNTQSDAFSAWTVGSLQVIDPIDSLFDGKRTVFPILIEGNQTTIRSRKGSVIDQQALEASLLIFINDVLQVPGEGYVFTGGSTIRFTEAPKNGDKSTIIFYRGTGEVDTQFIDILENIKVGDKVTINSENTLLSQKERLVTEIISSDTLETNPYPGPGISLVENLLRPLKWCRQTEDLFLNGQPVGKNRVIYEPYIQPSSNIIQDIDTNSDIVFVENVKAFFDSELEYLHDGTTEKPQNKILIISQDSLVSASATAVVSAAGTISSIILSNNGVGYSTTPSVSISNPIGVGGTGRAEASATITNGSISSISIVSPGFGYTSTHPPEVLFETPSPKYEVISDVSYAGDFGVITGIKTTSVGVASTGIILDLYIPENSPLRDGKTVTVGIATTGISGIQTGYYFVVNNSNVGNGLTSLNDAGDIVGIGTTFIDNIYQASSVSIAQTSVPGIGITYVAQVTVSVTDYNNLSGLGFSAFYGEYSWGRITDLSRKTPQQFTSYANIGGISTSPIVQRFNRLKYIGYSTT